LARVAGIDRTDMGRTDDDNGGGGNGSTDYGPDMFLQSHISPRRSTSSIPISLT
jgi:hypothetical protein